MQNVTGFGAIVSLVASSTFPVGIAITNFADDVDPLDMPSAKIGETAMGVNGDLLAWARAVVKNLSISVIPGSPDDVNLSLIAANNAASVGKVSANDTITVTIVYPDGSTITFNKGIMTDAPFGKSLASAGRLKTRTYIFSFESTTGS